MNSHPVKKNWRELFPSITNCKHWHQSTKLGKHRNTLSQMEFVQRKIKREREGFAPCARRITKECKAMLRNKIEQINLFNSTLLSNKFRDYTCFYCTQKGHVAKSCPTKLSDERLYAQAGAITFRHGDEATRARIRKNKESVKCFKCQGSGHFANACPQDDTKTTQKQEKETTAAAPSLPEPKVSVKYPEFIHFRTRGIIDGTDKGSWDDFWYISNTSNKHMTANLKFFSNLKEEFIVEKLEKQGKFLFTYGIGEVLIENGEGTYMIPGVHYAPEVTLNILSIGLLRQQGFEISSNGDRCTLAYMFKDKRGTDINLDRMREQHNNYLEDYFDALDRSANIESRIEQPYEKKDDDVEIGNFHECVAFLDLIRKGGALSNEWEVHRDKFNHETSLKSLTEQDETVCRKPCLDSFGEHAVHCKELPGFKYRHDMVRDLIFDICRRAGISAKKEAPVNFLTDPLNGRSTLRLADVLVFGWVGGKHACVDLTGVFPLVGLSSRGFTAGQAALKAALGKVTKHEKACIENQHLFIPFAFDIFGFLASEAVELLSRVQRVMHNNVMTPRSTDVVLKRIGFAIQKELAAQLVARLPSTTM
ncbi:ARID DNA-binding domain-containing protein [Tanacetum coccineum]